MTNKQILKIFKKALKKAEKNGFDYSKHFPAMEESIDKVIFIREEIILGIIFSHDFAEAIWGKEIKYWMGVPFRKMDYHRMFMVLEKEPLKYLEKFYE